jgi:hypothetical protein
MLFPHMKRKEEPGNHGAAGGNQGVMNARPSAADAILLGRNHAKNAEP